MMHQSHPAAADEAARPLLNLHTAVSESLMRWHSDRGGPGGLVRDIGRSTGWSHVSLWTLADANSLVCRATYDAAEGLQRAAVGDRRSRQHGVTGSGIMAGGPVLDPDGALALPLIAGERLAGTLVMETPPLSRLTEITERSLQAIGRQVGDFLAGQGGDLGPGPMTGREQEVLQLAANGGTMEAIAQRLGVAPSTIKTHFEHIFRKLGTHDRAHAVAEGMRRGLIR